MNLDGLWTEELEYKFESGLLNFEKMSDVYWERDHKIIIYPDKDILKT